jgi:hypothetical protein
MEFSKIKKKNHLYIFCNNDQYFVTKLAKYDKKGWSKNKFLAHSGNFKSAKSHYLLYFLPLWANNMQNFGKFLIDGFYCEFFEKFPLWADFPKFALEKNNDICGHFLKKQTTYRKVTESRYNSEPRVDHSCHKYSILL